MTALVLVGAGTIGRAAAQAAVVFGVVSRVGAVVDIDAGAREGAAAEFRCRGVAGLAELPPAGADDVALAAFSSSAAASAPVICALVEAGYDVVTTCEEMSDPAASERSTVDQVARSHGRAVVATGANPGFAMDRLVLAAAMGSVGVKAIDVRRRVDTSTRRRQLVVKTGRGLTEREFREHAATGRIGHVGLPASVRLVAAGLGWEIGAVDELIEPVGEGGGAVAGLHQRATAADDAGRAISLDLVMSWALPGPSDRIEIDGTPPLVLHIEGGYPGDEGTTACVVGALASARLMRPGLHLPHECHHMR